MLKKATNGIKKYSNKIDDGSIEYIWNEERHKITDSVNQYDNQVIKVTRLLGVLESVDLNDEAERAERNKKVSYIKNELDTLERDIPPLIFKIRKYVQSKAVNDEENLGEGSGSELEGNRLTFVEIQNNEEYLKKRKEALLEIHDLSSKMKEVSDQIVMKVNEGQEQLNSVENNVIKANENIAKGGKEVDKANEISKKNNKRLCFFISVAVIIVIIILIVIISIVTSGSKK